MYCLQAKCFTTSNNTNCGRCSNLGNMNWFCTQSTRCSAINLYTCTVSEQRMKTNGSTVITGNSEWINVYTGDTTMFAHIPQLVFGQAINAHVGYLTTRAVLVFYLQQDSILILYGATNRLHTRSHSNKLIKKQYSLFSKVSKRHKKEE